MNRLYPLILLLSGVMAFRSHGQDFWQKVEIEETLSRGFPERSIPEMKADIFSLEIDNIREYLNAAPIEFSAGRGLAVSIPLPDAGMKTFYVFDSPVMESGIAKRYPHIRSFVGRSDDGGRIHMGYGAGGFYAMVKSGEATIIIDNYNFDNDRYYAVYKMADYPTDYWTTFRCENEDHDHDDFHKHLEDLMSEERGDRNGNPVALRSYRLAMATTSQYSSRFGGTKESVMEELNKLVNRVNMVLYNDIGARLILINNTDVLIQLTGNVYTNGNAGAMINENPIVLQTNGVFPQDYDIGHVLGTNGGGLAQLNSLCTTSGQPSGSSKARGVSTWATVVGDPFHIQVVAHEVGHQFGANHSFNNCNEGGNERNDTGFEPGSGHTIMSYFGLCGPDNAAGSQLDNYGWHSLNEMFNHIHTGSASGCGTIVDNVNTRPTSYIDLEDGFTIPVGTPFKLTGRAEDNESDSSELTYSWEQADTGPLSPLGQPLGSAPLFRTYEPSASPVRYFPNLPDVLNGVSRREEVLPGITRPLTFRFVVRDNDPNGGAYMQSEISFSSTDKAGPFKFITSTAGETYEVGDYIRLEWDVAGTDTEPVNCKNVNILIAAQNGQQLVPVATNVINNGFIEIEIPDLVSEGLRFYIEAADNIFFNVSNGNFSIVEASEPSLSIIPSDYYLEICSPAVAEVSFTISPLGGFDGTAEINYLGGLPEGIEVSLDKTVVNASDEFMATFTIEKGTPLGSVDFELEIVTSTGLTFQRRIQLDISTLDVSGINVVGPDDGATGIQGAPTLRWTAVEHADEYVVTLKSLDGSIEYSTTTRDTSFTISELLAPATVFYWTVNIVNRCGYTPGENQRIFTFSTVNSACETFDSGLTTASPFILPSNSPGSRDFVLKVPAGGEISDVNIPGFTGGSTSGELSNLAIDLISPSGTQVTLIRNQCVGTGSWDIPFDDDLNTPFSCALANGVPRRTQFNNLKNFAGEEAQGDWIFRFNNSANANAQIRGLRLEICGNIETAPISLIHNEVLEVPTLQYQTITNNWLKAEDGLSRNDQLIYTVLELPKKGHIEVYGGRLWQGASFTQSAINDFGVVYYHTGSETDEEDSFVFVITNSTGGYLGTLVFDIVIDEGFVISNTEKQETLNFKVYPNPARGLLYLEIPGRYRNFQVDVLNMNGQVLKSVTYDEGIVSNEIDLNSLSAGTYIVRLSTREGIGFQKVIVL